MKEARTYRQEGVEHKAFVRILKREIALRDDPVTGGGQQTLAHEIAASGLMAFDTASRRLTALLNSNSYSVKPGGRKVVQQVVRTETVDKILCALDLTHLWHTELADAIVVPTCGGCGCLVDERSYGCKRCADRFSLRKLRGARRGPVPQERPSSSLGVDAGAGATTTQRRAA